MSQNIFPIDQNPAANKGILAAGPLTRQPGTRAYRYVIVERMGEYVVYNQGFGEHDNGSTDWGSHHFSSGSYCRTLVEATQRFAERLSRDVVHYDSLFRDTVLQ